MAKRRWRVEYDRNNAVWVAYPYHHAHRKRKGWVFHYWEDAFNYAFSNGKRTDIPRIPPAVFD